MDPSEEMVEEHGQMEERFILTVILLLLMSGRPGYDSTLGIRYPGCDSTLDIRYTWIHFYP